MRTRIYVCMYVSICVCIFFHCRWNIVKWKVVLRLVLAVIISFYFLLFFSCFLFVFLYRFSGDAMKHNLTLDIRNSGTILKYFCIWWSLCSLFGFTVRFLFDNFATGPMFLSVFIFPPYTQALLKFWGSKRGIASILWLIRLLIK